MSDEATWPEFYPEDCPPGMARVCDDTVYRLVSKNGMSEWDFLSHRERHPAQDFPEECKACGLSVFTDTEEVIRAKKRVPGMNKKEVARGKIKEEHGRILNTPISKDLRSHHTWWRTAEVDALSLFKVVTSGA